MSDESETLLLQAAQAGDMDAFDQLHIALEPDVMRFVRRLVGYDEATAEDITQDVFTRLLTHLHEVDPPEKLRPFVFRVARNRCYDQLRFQGRRDHLSLDDEPVSVRVSFDMQDDGSQPDEVTHWLLLYLEVQEVIDELPENQRQALLLYSEAGLSYGEIADVLDVSLGTVKSRLHHAKKTLRARVHPDTLAAISGAERAPAPAHTPPQSRTPFNDNVAHDEREKEIEE